MLGYKHNNSINGIAYLNFGIYPTKAVHILKEKFRFFKKKKTFLIQLLQSSAGINKDWLSTFNQVANSSVSHLEHASANDTHFGLIRKRKRDQCDRENKVPYHY